MASTGWQAGLLIALMLVGTGCSAAQSFDFFYFVLQWPASYCDLSSPCCYPNSGKPASNFSVHGLWPNYDDGSYPSNCDSGDTFDPSKISDLIPTMDTVWGSLACPSSDSTSFWGHEWTKHGTCSGMDEHGYFSSAVALVENIDFLDALQSAGISPNGQSYSLSKIKSVMASALGGHIPGLECNSDTSGDDQLYQVYVCVDTDGQTLIDCPIFPKATCSSSVYWPVF